jgi:hypothetical protein
MDKYQLMEKIMKGYFGVSKADKYDAMELIMRDVDPRLVLESLGAISEGASSLEALRISYLEKS